MKVSLALIASVVANLTFSTVGDICAELWRTTGSSNWFYVGFAVNLFTTLFFMVIIRLGGLAISTATVLIITILINVVVGSFIFGERINILQWIGIGLGVIAISLILHATQSTSVAN